MDLLDDDLFLEPAATNARGGGKFQPKVKPRPKKIASAPVSSALPNAEKKKVASVPSSSLETTQVGQPVDVVDDKLRNLAGSSTDAVGVSKTDEPAMDGDILLSDGTGSLELTNSPSKVNVAREDVGLDPSDDTHPEPVTKNARACGKSQPEVDPKPGKDLSASAASEISVADGNGDFVNVMPNSVACSTSENADVYFGLDGLEDFIAQPSSGKDTHASELPAAEEPQTLAETSQPVDAVTKDALLEDNVPLAKMGFRRGKRKTPAVSDNARKSQKSPAVDEEEDCGKTLMQLRKCSARKLIDEPDEEAQDNSLNDAEAPGNSVVDEVEDGDDEWREEGGKSKKKRAPRKKPVVGAEKPARKRRKAVTETDQSADQPPKKFSHSTRRTRRQVDRALIETPEEDLDLTNMPIKDLIMFYLHKEKMEDKETKSKEKEAKSKKSSTDASTQNDASHNEEDMFDTERDSDFMNNEGGDQVEETDPYFNYHSFMDKTSRSKWSKQDDELFYKCVRQFGIDLSMIQLLFPDRTRRQIKLKLKKEERQHPLRLTEAVQNRSKDHTQFQTIIEQIKKAKAEEDEFYGSESIGVTGDEDAEDFNPENNDEANKPEKKETAGDNSNDPEGDVEDATEKVESPSRFDEIDDDFDVDDYKSEY